MIIDEALNNCRAAVLILSPAAMASDWVTKEVNILLWRRALDPSVRVVPVLVPPITPEDERLARFRADELFERTFVQCAAPEGQSDEAIAAELAGKVAAAFASMAWGNPDASLERWLTDVSLHVRASKPDYWERAARALGLNEADLAQQVPRAHRMRDLPERIAHCMLHAPHARVLRAVAELADGLPTESRVLLRRWVAPLWVKPEAASYLPPVARAAEADRIIAINGRDPRSARAYVARAMCDGKRFHVVNAEKALLSETGQADLFDQVRVLLERYLGITEFTSEYDDDDDVDGTSNGDAPGSVALPPPEPALIRSLRGVEDPIFLAIGSAGNNAAALASLRRFPQITLLLLSGRTLPDPAALNQPRMRLVLPPLGRDEEMFAWRDFALELDRLIADDETRP